MVFIFFVSSLIVYYLYEPLQHEGAHAMVCNLAGFKAQIEGNSAVCPGIYSKGPLIIFFYMLSPYILAALLISIIALFFRKSRIISYLVFIPFYEMIANYWASFGTQLITANSSDFTKLFALGMGHSIFVIAFLFIFSLVAIQFIIKTRIYRCPFYPCFRRFLHELVWLGRKD